MTVITPKLGQKRLDSCDLARPKWAGFHEKRGKCGCDAFKIDEIALDDTVRVENAHQNGQTRPNNTLLGKYRIIVPDAYCGSFQRVLCVGRRDVEI